MTSPVPIATKPPADLAGITSSAVHRPAASPPQSTSPQTTPPAKKKPQNEDGFRETIESIVIAFLLAFLFRTFEAEAFVIPTGSMAPTLDGQHRDIVCEHCRFRYSHGVQVNQTLMLDRDARADDTDLRRSAARGPNFGKLVVNTEARAHTAICPNCRFPQYVAEDAAFTGDRILVNKFPYEFTDPKRWDVIVFKYPLRPNTNYIKRLVGLPNEEVRLQGGDVFVRPLGSHEPFRIARKPPNKQAKLQLPVYDDAKAPSRLIAAGFPERWSSPDGGWQTDPATRTHRFANDRRGKSRLEYRHLLPRAEHWNAVHARTAMPEPPPPELISDFYGYNARVRWDEARRQRLSPTVDNGGSLNVAEPVHMIDNQWVHDLTVSGIIETKGKGGRFAIEIQSGPRTHRCEIRMDIDRGLFSYRDGDEGPFITVAEFEPGLATGRHSFRFSNVDDRMCLWVDSVVVKSVDFETDNRFPSQPPDIEPTTGDLTPVRFEAEGGEVAVSQLFLERDIYYRSNRGSELDNWPVSSNPAVHREQFSNPELWSGRITGRAPQLDFIVGPDEYFVLGDNSPRSADSRSWDRNIHTVPRHLLIGQAFFIFWPHGVPFGGGNGRGLLRWEYDAEGNSDVPKIPYFELPFYPQWWGWKLIH